MERKNTKKRIVRKSKSIKKNKKRIRFIFILIFTTIVITLFVNKYIHNLLKNSIKSDSIQYIQQETIESDAETDTTDTDTIDADTKKEKVKKEPDIENQKHTETAVYYIRIIDETRLKAVKSNRKISRTLSVLRSTVEQLLLGPTETEISSGLKNFIPPETVLRHVYINESTVFLDFNDAFQFNSFGRRGVLAQLLQIVYTCSEFKNIDSVQIFIEGEKKTFLDGDGGFIFIDTPLTLSKLLEYAENM